MPLSTSYHQLGVEALEAALALGRALGGEELDLSLIEEFSWTLASEQDLQSLESFRRAGADTVMFLHHSILATSAREGSSAPLISTVSELYPYVERSILSFAAILNGKRDEATLRSAYFFALGIHDSTIHERQARFGRYRLAA